jgi:uncharacterized protein YecT (DUF1311 family)
VKGTVLKRLMGVIAALVYLTAVGSALADSPPPECASQATTVEMLTCSDWHRTQADALLNQTYAELRADLDETGKTLLLDAQRAWIAFRDAECTRVADAARDGTLSGVLQVACQQYLTAERARQLEDSKSMEMAHLPAFERVDSTAIGDFDCDGKPDLATLALVPLAPPSETLLTARLTIGEWSVRFPIGGDGQDSLCTGEVLMTVLPSFADASCPMVRIDDGACDSMFVMWDPPTKDFQWFRN